MRKRDRMRSGSVVCLTSWNYPRAQVRLCGEVVEIAFFRGPLTHGEGFAISRRLARMLAKRINQALDASA